MTSQPCAQTGIHGGGGGGGGGGDDGFQSRRFLGCQHELIINIADDLIMTIIIIFLVMIIFSTAAVSQPVATLASLSPVALSAGIVVMGYQIEICTDGLHHIIFLINSTFIWKSELSGGLKTGFFRATVKMVLLYGSTAWTLAQSLAKKLDGACTKMQRVVKNVIW